MNMNMNQMDMVQKEQIAKNAISKFIYIITIVLLLVFTVDTILIMLFDYFKPSYLVDQNNQLQPIRTLALIRIIQSIIVYLVFNFILSEKIIRDFDTYM